MSHNLSVWTASHIDVVERFNALIECVRAVNKFGLPHYISISVEKDINVNFDLLKYDNVTIFYSDEQLSQFAHLNNIDTNLAGRSESTEFIMFMDDDDVLVNLPPTIKQRESVQYLTEIVDRNDKYSIFREYRSGDSIICHDFSGTISTRECFQNFLRTFEWKNINITDLYFTCTCITDIDRNEDIKPYVFRRMWNPFSYIHYWNKQTLDQ